MKIFIILLIFFLSCNSTENEDSIIIDNIKKEWINSTQEYYDDFDEYIPIDSKDLPLLRYRQKYIFEDNGICKYYYLDPKDAHHYKDGMWDYESEKSIITIYDLEDSIIVKYKIEELSSILLKVRAIN